MIKMETEDEMEGPTNLSWELEVWTPAAADAKTQKKG